MDDLDPKVTVALIAAASAIVGALLGSISKGYSAAQKLKEIQYEHERREQTGYLASAREFTQAIYVPLSITSANLKRAYDDFIAKEGNEEDKHEFVQEIEKFLSEIDDLLSRGASAFLTTELDEVLISFCAFLRQSMKADRTVLKTVFSYNFSSSLLSASTKSRIVREVPGGKFKTFRIPHISANFGGIGLSFEASEILSASLPSEDFQQRFARDIYALNVLVKEVTLGANARKPTE